MRRSGVAGIIVGVIVATALSVSGQGPSPAQIQAAFRQAGLSGAGVYLDSQVPTWDSASGMFLPGNGGGGGGAPSDATYITQTANGSLSAEQALDLLNTGIMRVATGTGVVTSLTNSAGIFANISDETGGTGVLVGSISPSLTTPVLGVATATSINGLTISSSTGTLTIADGKVGTFSNTLTFTGTDSSSVAFGTGGTVAYTANKLSAFAATTSAELAGVISDEISAGAAPKLLFGDQALASSSSPTFNVLTVTSCTGCSSGGANTALSNLASVAINTALLPSGASIDLGSGSAPFRTGYLNTDLVMTGTTATIRANTADASDNSTVIIAAGGANGALRGASLQMYGNEHAQAGDAVLQIGGGTGGQFTVNGASAWLDIAGSSGATTIAGATSFSTTVSVTGHTTFEGVTSTGATGTGKIAYDTNPTFAGLGASTLVTSSNGPHAIGAATDANIAILTSADVTPAVNANGYVVRFTGEATEAASGTHDIIAAVSINGNFLNNGGATTTNAAALHITGAPGIATNKYSIWSEAGNIRFQGLPAGAAGDDDVCMSSTTNTLTDANASTCVVSSLRFKSNWQPLNVGLAEVLRLTPGSFYYTNDVKKVERIGLNAENMAVVEPRLAFYEQDGPDKGKPRGVAYEETVALLVKAIQELEARVHTLEER